MTPHRRLRRQLTLVYAVPFLASGAILLSIPLLSAQDSAPAGVPPGDSQAVDPAGLVGPSVAGLAVMVVVAVAIGWVVAGRFLRPLEESFETQRQFVANAAHELRTPLTAERTLLQVALADPAADLRATCDEVLALGRAQERLIDALLALATGEAGLERRERVDLAEVAAGVVSARSAEAAGRHVRITTDLAPAPVAGDPALVESLVANLVENAVRHNVPDGRVLVATSGARLTVRNTGPVVPPGEVASLFEPFRRLGPQRLSRADGHGLGLAVVRAVASAHRATVTPVAQPEGGLTVEVTFR